MSGNLYTLLFIFWELYLLETAIANSADTSSVPNSMQCSETGEQVCHGSFLQEHQTIHDAHIAEIHDVPMSVISRPIMPVLDEQKVLSLMETIKVGIDSIFVCIVTY